MSFELYSSKAMSVLIGLLVCGFGACRRAETISGLQTYAVIAYGIVRHQDGKPVAGARIEAEIFYDGCTTRRRSGRGETFSDASGSYKLEIVSATGSSTQCAIVQVKRGPSGEVLATHQLFAPTLKVRRTGVVPDSVRVDLVLQP